MSVDVFNRVVSVDDPAAFSLLAALVSAWEPVLELYRPRPDALLYEPDGTLYAICLADELSFKAGHRERTVSQGDAVVIPRAYAVDVGPAVDLLAVRHDGPSPDHFRERFIQVWGYDHLPVPNGSASVEVIPWADVRFRIPYAVFRVHETEGHILPASDELGLLLVLRGVLRLGKVGEEAGLALSVPPRSLVALSPATGYRLVGEGLAGVLTLLTEWSHDARRRGGAGTSPPSPEYRSAETA